MRTKSKHTTGDNNSLWNWKGNIGNKKKSKEKGFPVIEFLRESSQKMKENTLGPGCGIGVGCGAGLGFGLVGGIGYGGWPWNHLRLVFKVGAGCGVGFGYRQGIGYGFSLDSSEDYMSK